MVKGKSVTFDSSSCQYFKPTYFYCDQNNCRLTYGQCLARRRNTQNLMGYLACKKCRQFDTDIREIIMSYFIDMIPIIIPRKFSKDNNDQSIIGSGKIKRRQKDNGNKRKIKRRDKPEQQGPNNKRKIKRRDKHNNKKDQRTIKRRSKPKTHPNGLTYKICPKCGQEGMRDNYCRVCAYQPKNGRQIKRRTK